MGNQKGQTKSNNLETTGYLISLDSDSPRMETGGETLLRRLSCVFVLVL